MFKINEKKTGSVHNQSIILDRKMHWVEAFLFKTYKEKHLPVYDKFFK